MIKRLLRFAGGQPVRSQDLELIQDAFNGITVEMAKAFGTDYILYGTVNDERTTVVEGAVVIKGEVYKVPALGTIGSNKLCFRYADSDEREFFNGQKHKVVRTCEAYLSTDTGNAQAWIDLKTAKRINADLLSRLDTLDKGLKDEKSERTQSVSNVKSELTQSVSNVKSELQENINTVDGKVNSLFTHDLSGWKNIPLASGVTGKAEYIYPVFGNCMAMRINVCFQAYKTEGYKGLFERCSMPATTDEALINVTVTYRGLSNRFLNTPLGLHRDGRLFNESGEAVLNKQSYGDYCLKGFYIIPLT